MSVGEARLQAINIDNEATMPPQNIHENVNIELKRSRMIHKIYGQRV